MLVDRIALAYRFACRPATRRSWGLPARSMRSAGRQVLQRPFQHLGAADHVLEGGHGVLPLRFLVGDRRVEAIAAVCVTSICALAEYRRGAVA